ncbi:MAG: restriction endonuclease subunit S [Pseudomonadota bacterium]|nr:restriction endonuclease subunit S [Pseudomonadota bacterium]
MPSTVVSNLVELVTDKQVADPAKPEAYIGLEHIPERAIRIEKVGDIEAIRGMCVRYREGDILFGKLRPNLRKSVLAPVDGLGSTEILVLRPKPGLDASFAGQVLRSETVFFEAERMTEGTRMPRTSWKTLSGIEVFTPAEPHAQKLIADILDAIDNAILETDALVEKLLAIRIGLTEDLLTFGIAGGRSRSVADAEETSLGLVPASWSRGALGSMAETLTSGSRGWAKFYSDRGAKFLRIGNLTRQHINLRLDDLVYVTPPKGQEGKRTAVQENDLLISITADLGVIGSIPPSFGEAYVNQHIALVRLKESEVNPRWPAHFLSSRRSQIMFQKLNDQGAKAGINLPAVEQIQVPLPPREEQDALVERLDAADEDVARYRIEREKLAALRLGLRDDLLTGRKSVIALRQAAE